MGRLRPLTMELSPLSSLAEELRAVQSLLLVWLALGLALEAGMRALRRLPGYEPRAIVHAFEHWSVMELGRFLTVGLRLSAFHAVAAWAPLRLASNALVVCLAFVLVDLVYYLRHRWMHATPLGRALHEPHHASRRMTLLASIRLGWAQRLVDDFFYLPLLLLGFDPTLLFVTIEVNHAVPLWCHTDAVGRLPWLDPWLNTPSNHRVHHAADEALRNRNLGAASMLWDRLFGTYEREPEGGVARFGLGAGDRGDGVLAQQLAPLVSYARSLGRRSPEGASVKAVISAACRKTPKVLPVTK